ncbi:MAG: hypothetical protein CL933_12815 [Deltaproteobacteria bacterium]|nr:hypothetical protein [Deltaproteobacteria bacterium]
MAASEVRGFKGNTMNGRMALLALSLVVMFASAASAELTWTATATASGGDINNMTPGDTVTIDITLRSDAEGVYGFGGAAYGYDLESVTLDGANSYGAVNVLNTICVAGPMCFGGMTDQLAGNQPVVQGAEVQFFNGVSITPVTGTGAADEQSNVPGFAVGDGQFRLTFTVHANSTIQIGDGGSGDGAIGNGGASLASNNTSVAFSVIPEPATALLMGLGLAGLGLAGRRE